MTGREYLENIKRELEAGRNQWRMGENLLDAFGYIRRRQTGIDEINATLSSLGMRTNLELTTGMPLRAPRIRFFLREPAVGVLPDVDPFADTFIVDAVLDVTVVEEPEEDDEAVFIAEEVAIQLVAVPELVAAFRIGELAAAEKQVECIGPDAPLDEAYTRMTLSRFSQLVVANGTHPAESDIKGVISFRSIAKALIQGGAGLVRDCMDPDPPRVRNDTDLREVLPKLGSEDFVLVLNRDWPYKLQGIVTAWDMSEEFAQLVDPFKRIGEIEARLRALLGTRLGIDRVREFLQPDADGPTVLTMDGLTIGELLQVVQNKEIWADLHLLGMHRGTFIEKLNQVRMYRNRLMHFRDPLEPNERAEIGAFCDLVRDIPVAPQQNRGLVSFPVR